MAQVITRRPAAAVLTTRYLYDADGNRVARRSSRSGQTADKSWLYVRSSSGAELALLSRIARPDSTFVVMQEASIGSEQRLGTYARPTLLAAAAGPALRPAFAPEPAWLDTVRSYGREPGYRRYQIADHLGNVRVVVSDQKAADTTGEGLFLSARVLSASEYYPFGMMAV